jgi:hypothetical protein
MTRTPRKSSRWPKTRLEDLISLDVTAAGRAGLFTKGIARVGEVTITAGRVAASLMLDGIEHRVELVREINGMGVPVVWFACPVCRCCCRILYHCHGRFECRPCTGAIHSSQRGSLADKLRRRLAAANEKVRLGNVGRMTHAALLPRLEKRDRIRRLLQEELERLAKIEEARRQRDNADPLEQAMGVWDHLDRQRA